jgi:hypothetical protein
MQQPIEQRASPRNRRLNHDNPSTGRQNALGFLKEVGWILDVMEHVDHHDIAHRSVCERQHLCVGDTIKPGRRLDIGRNDVLKPLLQISDTAAEFNGQTRNALGGDPPIEIVIDEPEHWLAVPDFQMVAQHLGHRMSQRLDAQECKEHHPEQ